MRPASLSQPHFEGNVRSPLTLPKMGLESPLGLPKTQRSIVGVKTPRLEVFFTPLERSSSVDVQNGLAWAIWTSAAQVMVERRAGSQTATTPTTKSQKWTRSRCVQVECDTLLESSQGELQVFFRPHPNRRSELGVMNAQSPWSLIWDSFETPLWESRDKKPFGCSLHEVTQSILYGGRWWLPSSPGRGETSESVLPVPCPNTKKDPECGLTTLWLVLMQVRVSE
jgi:hypothetical protein